MHIAYIHSSRIRCLQSHDHHLRWSTRTDVIWTFPLLQLTEAVVVNADLVWLVKNGRGCLSPSQWGSSTRPRWPCCGWNAWAQARELHRERASPFLPTHVRPLWGMACPSRSLPAGRMELWSWELADLCNVTMEELERRRHISLFTPQPLRRCCYRKRLNIVHFKKERRENRWRHTCCGVFVCVGEQIESGFH